MDLQDYQTEEPITTKKIIYEGDKKIETTISKKKIKQLITTQQGENSEDNSQININPNEYVFDIDYIDLPFQKL